MKITSVLVSGASGFVAGHLLARLVEGEGADRVVALDNRPPSEERRRRFGGRVRWLQADLCCDDLSQAVEGIDTVFHLAARFSIDDSPAECTLMDRVNVLGTGRLAAACRDHGVRKFIFVSSVAACQSAAVPVIDETNGYPTTAYGRSKRAAENLLLGMSGEGFEVTVLRPTALFGEEHQGSIFELVRAINKGRFVIIGGGNNRTNFYYVGDFVEVLTAVADSEAASGQVFIAADRPTPLHELAQCIRAATGSRYPLLRIPRFMGKGIAAGCDAISALSGRSLPLSRRRLDAMTNDTAYSSRKLEQAIGLRPTYGLDAGIRRTVAWYRQNGLI